MGTRARLPAVWLEALWIVFSSASCDFKEAQCQSAPAGAECTSTNISVSPLRLLVDKNTPQDIAISFVEEDIIPALAAQDEIQVFVRDAKNQSFGPLEIGVPRGKTVTAHLPAGLLSESGGGLGAVQIQVGNRRAEAEVRLFAPAQYGSLSQLWREPDTLPQVTAALAGARAALAVLNCPTDGSILCKISLSQIVQGNLVPPKDKQPTEFVGSTKVCLMGATKPRLLVACQPDSPSDPTFQLQVCDTAQPSVPCGYSATRYPPSGRLFGDATSDQAVIVSSVLKGRACAQIADVVTLSTTGQVSSARTLPLLENSTIQLLAFGQPPPAELKQAVPDIVTLDDNWSSMVFHYSDSDGWAYHGEVAAKLTAALKRSHPMGHIPIGLALSDFDQDGLLDLLVASVQHEPRVPVSAADCGIAPAANNTPGIRLQLLSGLNLSGQQHLAEPLTALKELRLPANIPNTPTGVDDFTFTGIAVGDLDRDGDIDIALTDPVHGIVFANNMAR